jgi:hypothetical protein
MSLINYFEKKRFCKKTADGYLFEILNLDVDYVINIDEDAFISDKNALFSLLDYMIDNNYDNCGMPDGGVLPIRIHHPLVTNPFFNIMNVRKIKKELTNPEIEKIEFDKPSYIEKLPEFITREYNFDDYEPYNKLFIWLALNFKTLYLNAKIHHDNISTILLNQNGEQFLYHSWYSREFGNDNFHTSRINNLFFECQKNDKSVETIFLIFKIKCLIEELISKLIRKFIKTIKLIRQK